MAVGSPELLWLLSRAEAYERLLLDALEGDASLFARADEVEAAWRLFTPVLGGEYPVHEYASGSWGPREADALLDRDGEQWTVLSSGRARPGAPPDPG